MFVVPVLAVGGWGWWSTHRMKQRHDDRPAGGERSAALDVAPR